MFTIGIVIANISIANRIWAKTNLPQIEKLQNCFYNYAITMLILSTPFCP